MLRRSHRFVLPLVLGASALTSTVLVPAAPAGAATRCSRPLVIGIRGSGETKADGAGYGTTVAVALDTFRRAATERFDAEPFDYPARPVTDLLDPRRGRTRYFAGVAKGIRALEQRLRAVVAACPRRAIVVLAYSQGALVADRAIVDLDRNRPTFVSHIAALELIADPQRLAGSPFALGSANPAFSGLGSVLGAYPPDQIPQSLWPVTDTICIDGDVVCAWNPSPESLQQLLTLPTAIVDAHTSYSKNNLAALAGYNAATRLAARATR